jgi:hypothetical protein
MRPRLAALALLVALVAGCGKPLPPDKHDYAGAWEGPQMQLVIGENGRLAYARRKSSGTVSVKAPINEFRPDGFSAGIGPFKTFFRVDRPPHLEQGEWRMTVDGVELRRRGGGAVDGTI